VNRSNGHVDLTALPIEERAPALRKLLGLKQTDFAAEVGVNVRQVKRWEAGAVPSEESAHELARVAPRKLKARPEWFFVPRERREERVTELERRVDALERRLRKAGI
jgi:transcriptional regulator with XRE-family HTH domain